MNTPHSQAAHRPLLVFMEFWGTTIALWVKRNDARIKILPTLSTCPLCFAASKNTSSLWSSDPDNTFVWWNGVAAWLLRPQPKHAGFRAQKMNSPTIVNIYTRGGGYLFPARGGGIHPNPQHLLWIWSIFTYIFWKRRNSRAVAELGENRATSVKSGFVTFFVWWNTWFSLPGMRTQSPGDLRRCWCEATRRLLVTSPQHSGDLRLEIKPR